MPLNEQPLNKTVQLFFADGRLRNDILRKDAYRSARSLKKKNGGNFHTAFWSDAKDYIAGTLDLTAAIEDRIKKIQNVKDFMRCCEMDFSTYGTKSGDG